MPLAARVTGPEDAPAVGELLRASYPVLMRAAYGEALSAVIEVITRPNPALLESGTFYAAENGRGQMVGIGGWSRERPGDARTEPGLAHLRHFATHPDWCHRGVGRLIYEDLRDARAGIGNRGAGVLLEPQRGKPSTRRWASSPSSVSTCRWEKGALWPGS